MDYVTLLLVEDDVDLLRLLQRRFESDGFDTLPVEGGRQARIALERRLPDLAIVDILMPEMDGFEVAEMIKRRGDIPIVFLTSVGDSGSVALLVKLDTLYSTQLATVSGQELARRRKWMDGPARY